MSFHASVLVEVLDVKGTATVIDIDQQGVRANCEAENILNVSHAKIAKDIQRDKCGMGLT